MSKIEHGYKFGRSEIMFIPGVGAVEWPPFVACHYKGDAIVVTATIALHAYQTIDEPTRKKLMFGTWEPVRPDPGPLQPNVADWKPEKDGDHV